MTYYRTGSGPPVVAAHGFYDDGRRWQAIGDRLADEYTVVAYDARGFGRSDAPETGYTPADRAADLRAVVRGLDLDRPVLLGHSMGAVTVAHAAARFPELPRGVVLEDPEAFTQTPDAGPDERAEMVREQLAELADTPDETLIAESPLTGDRARRDAAAIRRTDPAVTPVTRHGYPEPVAETLTEVRASTLVVRGDHDVRQRIADCRAAEAFEGRLVHVAGADHYVFRDALEPTMRECRAFLGRL